VIMASTHAISRIHRAGKEWENPVRETGKENNERHVCSN
jgi:hypothetical protein